MSGPMGGHGGGQGGPTRGQGPRRGGPMGGPPWAGMTMPAEKPQDFRGTLRRLVGVMRPERPLIMFSIVLAFVSTAGTVFGPKILGNAINQLVDGLLGKQIGPFLPPGTTHDQAVEILRKTQPQIADLFAGTTAIPGVGVDFAALGGVLIALAALYLATALVAWLSWYTMAGVAQRTVYRLRRDVDTKLARLPLKYFDTHQRGDTLSRVTNDIDNIGNTLQQSLSQIITSLATIVGVLAMMFWISPLLAAVSLLVIPLAILLSAVVVPR